MGVESIGTNILKLRRNKGVTQEALAEFIGVTKTSVSKWETGDNLAGYSDITISCFVF